MAVTLVTDRYPPRKGIAVESFSRRNFYSSKITVSGISLCLSSGSIMGGSQTGKSIFFSLWFSLERQYSTVANAGLEFRRIGIADSVWQPVVLRLVKVSLAHRCT